jgi:hypothetical protein
MYKCGECQIDVAFDSVETEVDGGGCYFTCPGCKARNPLVNVAYSMGGKADDIWLAQPSIFGQGWKARRE